MDANGKYKVPCELYSPVTAIVCVNTIIYVVSSTYTDVKTTHLQKRSTELQEVESFIKIRKPFYPLFQRKTIHISRLQINLSFVEETLYLPRIFTVQILFTYTICQVVSSAS
jgi:hypothetical protein